MPKRKQHTKGVRDPKDLKAVRRQIDKRNAKGKSSRRVNAAPADVAPTKHKPKTYDWTPARDEQLRVNYTGHRGDIASLAKAFELPFHVVKQRAKELGLVAAKTTRRRAHAPALTEPAAEATTTPAPAAAEDPIEAAKRLRHAICPNRPKCYTRAMWDPTDTLEQLREQGFIYGLDPDSNFPICPNCRTTMVSSEPVEVPEAFAQAAAAAGSHQPRLWPDPPFNFHGAWMQLEAKEDEILDLQTRYDELSKQARKAAKDLAKANKERTAMVAELRKRRLQKAREDLNRRDQAELPELIAGCAFEAHVGKPCPVCRAESPSLVAAALHSTNGALTEISTEAHRELAVKANSRAIDIAEKLLDAGLVADALTARGLLGIPVEVVETWDQVQRRDALGWVDGGMDRSDVPAVLGLPHIAATAGEDAQCCVECGARILQLKTTDGDVEPYAVGAFVGTHCTGIEVGDRAPAAESAEARR